MGDPIIIVSGLPRSGTSMMMSMLQAGGVELLDDGRRAPDESNPKGYFELERVKNLARDSQWLARARGKAVKLISSLLHHLPSTFSYRVIFMRRKLDEILASQKEMLTRRGVVEPNVSDARLRSLCIQHLNDVMEWLSEQSNLHTLYVRYDDTVADPMKSAGAISRFLEADLDTAAMASILDPSLYRQKR